MRSIIALAACVLLMGAPGASAQAPAASGSASGDSPLARLLANSQDRIDCPSIEHCRLTGTVDIDLGNETRFNADEIDIYTDPSLRVVAAGNVVFSNPQARVSAERVEFNVDSGTGIFHNARASMTIEGANRAEFGNQQPDFTFDGETIEKTGPRSYRLTRGTLTTCVQPTPRWEIVSASITIHLDEYAIARNMLLRVKGVPLMYLPIIYYPIQDDQRATGFLLPTYGTSTIRGQAISNAFFLVLGRSQDMTFFHDWFTRAGQGAGVEYRYAAAAGSFGTFRFYRFGQRQAEFTEDGATGVLPSTTSYQFTGNGTHMLGRNIRLYQRIDYVTDLTTRQLYQQNVYDASNASRSIEAGLAAAWGRLNTTALVQRTETFTGFTGDSTAQTSQIYGSTPRLTASIAPTPLGRAPAYVSVTSDFAYLPNKTLTGDMVTRDVSVARFDLQPRIQAALSRLTYLSINTTAAYRVTQYNRSEQSPAPVQRRYLSMRTEAVGPVFAKVWDTPDAGFSERMKHVIEPTFAVDHVTDIANALLVPSGIDTTDQIVGDSTRFIYGLTNRFFYRARATDNSPGTTVEYLTVRVQQTYYRNTEASLRDTDYVSSTLRSSPVDLSNVLVQLRVSPSSSGALDGTARLEYDVHGRGLQVVTAGVQTRQGVSTSTVSYSRSFAERASTPTSSLSGSTSVGLLDGRLTSGYGLTWDISRATVLSQSISTTYLAQCCGIQAEFQKFSYPRTIPGFPVPSDRRFNVGVVLAGLGTFSNFFGAFDSLVGIRR
jgi:LPS-assembly protein